MKIMAFDTAVEVAAVAVMEDTKLLGEYIINNKKKHSEKLMPLAESLLKDLSLSPSDIDIFAVSIGPGSFTGIRIGVSAVKALAYATGKKIAGIPTLDALAFNASLYEGVACPLIDARNHQVYTALYKCENGRQEKLTQYMAVDIDEIIEKIRMAGENTVFIGDAAELHKDMILSKLGNKAHFMPGNLQIQRASAVAQLAYIKAVSGETDNCFELAPLYLRKPQAERELEKKNQTCGSEF